MARIQGVDLPNKKRIDIALTSIFGIGRFLAAQILEKANIDPSRKTMEITEAELARIRNVIQNDRNENGEPSYRVEGDLRKFNAECIKCPLLLAARPPSTSTRPPKKSSKR